MVSDETFFAWLDGELDSEEAARVAAEVEADAELAARAKDHRALRTRLDRAFGSLVEAPVPAHLSEAIRLPQAEVIILPSAAERSLEPRTWTSLPRWAGLAATLAIGVFIGTMAAQRDSAPVAIEGGKLYAASILGDALDTELASDPSSDDLRINLTFRDRSGAICRSFTQAAASGLACREGERWQVRGLFAAPEGQGGPYRMAAGMDPNLAALVTLTMAGEPFDAAAEKAAKEKGWR